MYNDTEHYRRLYETVPREFAFNASTPAEVAAWQEAFRPRLKEVLGVANLEADLAGHVPTAEQVDVEDVDDFIRESWRLMVEPTVPLPFYVLRPKTLTEPVPLILTPHGHNQPYIYAGIAHSDEEQARMRDGQRDIAVQAVRQGYIAIAPTTRAFGETRAARNANDLSSCRINLLHGLLVGRTAIGERVWDMSRLIDWAVDALPIDPDRIAMTGNSGGGTVTLFSAACDTRIKVAVPSCYFCTFAGSIGFLRHCDCNYVPGILRLGEMYDVAGLTAPRAFGVIAGEKDTIFPIEHVRFAFEQLQRVYAAAGVPERCRLYVGSEGHRYYSDGSWDFIRAQFEASS
jgi:hypothetical protein